MPLATVIVPAHNEEKVIRRCLDALGTGDGDLEVIVVANGCSDTTAAIALQAGAKVIDLSEGNKITALNSGDSVASCGTRIYLDADVVLTKQAALATVEALNDGALAAAPHPVFDTTCSSFLVQSFYRAWRRSPFLSDSTIGNGVYGISSEGRKRFGVFPQVVGDDAYVHGLFSEAERKSLPDDDFIIHTPRDVRSLISVRTRVHYGNAELRTAPVEGELELKSSSASALAVVRTSRSISELFDAGIYLAVNAVAKVLARRKLNAGKGLSWYQDASSRSNSSR